jgi:hypothetical protein
VVLFLSVIVTSPTPLSLTNEKVLPGAMTRKRPPGGVPSGPTKEEPLHGEDDFPLVGTYTENLACKTDGSDARVSRITITPRDIDSVFGLCTILSKKREGATFVVHVECKGPGGSQMLSDVNLTPREDKTIDFSDQDQTYKAVLYRCPD